MWFTYSTKKKVSKKNSLFNWADSSFWWIVARIVERSSGKILLKRTVDLIAVVSINSTNLQCFHLNASIESISNSLKFMNWKCLHYQPAHSIPLHNLCFSIEMVNWYFFFSGIWAFIFHVFAKKAGLPSKSVAKKKCHVTQSSNKSVHLSIYSKLEPNEQPDKHHVM